MVWRFVKPHGKSTRRTGLNHDADETCRDLKGHTSAHQRIGLVFGFRMKRVVQSLTFKIGRKNKFHWGLNVDDIWTYAGLAVPKSVVIPYLFSFGLRGGPFTLPQGHKSANIKGGKQSASTANVTTKRRDARRPAELLASFLKKNGVDFVRCWFQ